MKASENVQLAQEIISELERKGLTYSEMAAVLNLAAKAVPPPLGG